MHRVSFKITIFLFAYTYNISSFCKIYDRSPEKCCFGPYEGSSQVLNGFYSRYFRSKQLHNFAGGGLHNNRYCMEFSSHQTVATILHRSRSRCIRLAMGWKCGGGRGGWFAVQQRRIKRLCTQETHRRTVRWLLLARSCIRFSHDGATGRAQGSDEGAFWTFPEGGLGSALCGFRFQLSSSRVYAQLRPINVQRHTAANRSISRNEPQMRWRFQDAIFLQISRACYDVIRIRKSFHPENALASPIHETGNLHASVPDSSWSAKLAILSRFGAEEAKSSINLLT